jgi:hypothetical protein
MDGKGEKATIEVDKTTRNEVEWSALMVRCFMTLVSASSTPLLPPRSVRWPAEESPLFDLR